MSWNFRLANHKFISGEKLFIGSLIQVSWTLVWNCLTKVIPFTFEVKFNKTETLLSIKKAIDLDICLYLFPGIKIKQILDIVLKKWDNGRCDIKL